MPDPLDAESPCKWAYADGSGVSCYYCLRTYENKGAHRHERTAYQGRLAVDKAELDKFIGWRQEYISRLKSGCKQGVARGDGGSHPSIFAPLRGSIPRHVSLFCLCVLPAVATHSLIASVGVFGSSFLLWLALRWRPQEGH